MTVRKLSRFSPLLQCDVVVLQWLKLMGLKVSGASIVIADQLCMSRPDLISIEAPFFSGSMTNFQSDIISKGTLRLQKLSFARNSVIGNNSYVGQGSVQLPANTTLGALTCVLTSQQRQLQENSIWIGSPSSLLRRTDAATNATKPRNYWAILEVMFIVLAFSIISCAVAAIYEGAYFGYQYLGFYIIPLLPFVMLFGIVFLLVHALVYRMAVSCQPQGKTIHFHSFFAILRRFLQMVGWLPLQVFGSMFGGTKLYNLYWKAKGSKMSFNSQVFTTEILEPEMVTVQERAFIGREATIQCHMVRTMEGFEYESVLIGEKASLGSSSVVLPGAVIRENVLIGEMSLIAQKEHFPSNSMWLGSPCEELGSRLSGSALEGVTIGSSSLPAGIQEDISIEMSNVAKELLPNNSEQIQVIYPEA
jgi:non-ribosomal peptide synthetase-like protein